MIYLGVIVGICMISLIYVSRKCNNDCKLIFKMGKKRCGKTSDIAKEALKEIRRGVTVYSTVPVPGVYHIRPEDIGQYEFEKYSHIFIDEVGLVWHARDFKTFSSDVREWFKLQGHRKLTVTMYSQCFDIDKGLRDLCDEIYICKKIFNTWCYQKKVVKDLKVVEATAEAESRFADNLRVQPFIVPGARKFTYLPKYFKYFDSFDAPELHHRKFKYMPPNEFDITVKSHKKVQKWLKKRELQQRIRARYSRMSYQIGLIRKARQLDSEVIHIMLKEVI